MNRVLVLYHSREDGYTDLMAKAVAEGAREAGAEVILANTSEARFDPDAYRRFDAAAFGTPDYYSYVAGTLKTFADNLYSREGKLPGLFYSHGGGNVREPFEKLFKYLGGKKIGDTVESSGKPSAAILRTCRKLGAESGARRRPPPGAPTRMAVSVHLGKPVLAQGAALAPDRTTPGAKEARRQPALTPTDRQRSAPSRA
jgi:NAD(P)H dehydrogenase (quinone)